MDNLTLNLQELFEEIKERAFSEGAFSREEWADIVDEVIEEKREVQEIHDDVDLTEMREALKARFEEFEAEIPTA
jgi:broad-specificity NMP kinase